MGFYLNKIHDISCIYCCIQLNKKMSKHIVVTRTTSSMMKKITIEGKLPDDYKEKLPDGMESSLRSGSFSSSSPSDYSIIDVLDCLDENYGYEVISSTSCVAAKSTRSGIDKYDIWTLRLKTRKHD